MTTSSTARAPRPRRPRRPDQTLLIVGAILTLIAIDVGVVALCTIQAEANRPDTIRITVTPSR